MTRHSTPASATFIGAVGNRLIADMFGDSGSPVLLLHGGGQTRHAWQKTAEQIARKGHVAYAVDQRGHGESDWVADGAYEFLDYAADTKTVATELTRRSGTKPIVIGASLGGLLRFWRKAMPNAIRAPIYSRRLLCRQSERGWSHLPADLHRYLHQGELCEALRSPDADHGGRPAQRPDIAVLRRTRREAVTSADRPRPASTAAIRNGTNTSCIWPSKTSTTRAPRRRARKRTVSASASTKQHSTNSIVLPSGRRCMAL